jgi:hypothetical protein
MPPEIYIQSVEWKTQDFEDALKQISTMHIIDVQKFVALWSFGKKVLRRKLAGEILSEHLKTPANDSIKRS